MTTDTPPPHQEQPESRPPGLRLTARQQELLEELMALDPELAGLYRRGLGLLPELQFPGGAHLLGHVGRELTLGVVDALLEEGWSLSERELSQIPDDERHRGKIASSLGLTPSDRRVTQWFELHGDFSGAAHYRRGDSSPDAEKLRLNFARLEQLLYGRVGPYFRTQADLDVLLLVAEPDDHHVEQLQAVLLRPQQRRYFFSRLANAKWIVPLDRMEAFRNPPERRVHPDGSWQLVAWPEGEFLARAAPDQPQMVVEILERLPTSIENPAVWQVVAAVANEVSPELGRRLVPNLMKATGNVLPVVFADGLLKLIARLAHAGYSDGFDLSAALLFVPSAGEVGEVSPYSLRSDWLFPRLRWSQFTEFTARVLPALERSDQQRTLALLLSKLNQIAAVARKLDVMRLVVPRFGSRGHRHPDDVATQVVEATSEMLARLASGGPEDARRALEMLEQYEGELFTRLRYRLIAAAGKHLQGELDSLLSSTLAVEPDQLGREIAGIVREQYGNASEGARGIFRYALQRGPDPETMRDTLGFRQVERPSPANIEDVKRAWQRRRLTWFRGVIPDELRDLAEDLEMWGEKPSIEDQELAEVGFYSGEATWGEPRPFTPERLSERSPDEIARLITEWRPTDRSYETGSTHGLELSVQELAAADPQKALGVWEVAGDDLPPGFVRSLLDGLRDALKGETPAFDWARALSFARAAVLRATGSDDSPEEMRRALLRSATGLIEDGAGNDLIPPALEEDVWRVTASAITSALAWSEEGEGVESFGALLTAALNRTASRGIQAALHAGLWSYRLRKSEDTHEGGSIAEKRLAPILDEVLKRSGVGRVTAEAIIGQFLPQLRLIAPKWLEAHLAELLDSGATEPLEHPVWGAYVTRGRLYDSTFRALRPWYARAAEAAGTAPDRVTSDGDHWSLTRSLAEHVIIAVLRGLAAVGDPDGLVEKTFANVAVSERGKAYWAVFRDWSDAENAPPAVFANRLLLFWEWRLDQLEQAEDDTEATEEAQGLGWFLLTPHLPDSEVLRLGIRTAKASKGKLEHTDWDRLRALATTDADAVYDIAEVVLKAQLSEPHHYVPVNEVKALLRFVLGTGKPATRSRARRLVNQLLETGYDDFRDLLE